MNETGPNIQSSGMGVSFWATLAAVPLVLGLGQISSWGLASADAVLLSISILAAVLLGGHEGRVPFTKIRLSSREIVTFWGIVTLGVMGGTLVAAAGILAGYSDRRVSRLEWLRSAIADAACSVCAAGAFTLTLNRLRMAGPFELPVDVLVPNEILAASVAMLAAYFAARVLASFLLSLVNAGRPDTVRASVNRQFGLLGHVLAAAMAIIMFAAFKHFGNALGLIVLPLIVLGNVAYQIHLRRLEQKTRELVDASRLHLATVEALATAIDARDQVGIGHVRRTQIYAIGIGTALGLDDGDLSALRAAALLHDIGKLAVPEHILNKPGRLTSAELEKTKIHANVGASILGKVGFPYPVVPTVRHHHEHWDGSGYPDGLRGDGIPVTARILAVADAYDALRGHRPFRAALNREDACSFLRSRAGNQFDPHIVNTFLRNLRELEAEIEIHGFGYETDIADPDAASDGETNYVEQIKRANQEVFSLYEMARDFGASLNLQETLELLTAKVREFVPYDTCLIYLLDEDKEHATAAHVEGRNKEALLGKGIVVGEGATGYVLKKRKPVENVDPSLDFAFSHPEICEHYVGMAAVPLLSEDNLIGAISVFSHDLAVYEEEHLRLLETISRIAADAICKSIKHAETEIYAQTDALTGLPNARGLQLQFEKEIGRARRADNSMQVLMLDLDGFKAVNDTFGHKAGDVLLKEIGSIIKTELRDYDFLARYGGDEFVALIPETDSADVIELCSRIEAAVESYMLAIEGSTASVGVSVGAACYPTHGETFEQLLIAADKAMYRAKAFHKQRNERLVENAHVTVLPELQQVVHAHVLDAAPMPAALAERNGEFVVELDESHIVVVNTIN